MHVFERFGASGAAFIACFIESLHFIACFIEPFAMFLGTSSGWEIKMICGKVNNGGY